MLHQWRLRNKPVIYCINYLRDHYWWNVACLWLAILRVNIWMDFHEMFRMDWTRWKEQMATTCVIVLGHNIDRGIFPCLFHEIVRIASSIYNWITIWIQDFFIFERPWVDHLNAAEFRCDGGCCSLNASCVFLFELHHESKSTWLFINIRIQIVVDYRHQNTNNLNNPVTGVT